MTIIMTCAAFGLFCFVCGAWLGVRGGYSLARKDMREAIGKVL